MEMRYNENTGYDHLDVVECGPGLEDCVTSSESTSETMSINAVDVSTAGGTAITVCDTPGFNDNRGVEIDISNGIGIIAAVRGARSVRPLFLLSRNDAGERMDGVVSILQMAVAMMSPIEKQIPSFNYWFTKYPPNEYKANNKLFVRLRNKHASVLETKIVDGGILSVMEDMVSKIKETNERAVVLDPEHDDRNALLNDLLDVPFISNPNEVNIHNIHIQYMFVYC
jgi:hypothetical protein